MKDFIFAALNYACEGRWREVTPGESAAVYEQGKGMYVSYGGPLVVFACGIALDLKPDRQTILTVAELGTRVSIGSMQFGEQMDERLCLLLVERIQPRWLQPGDEASMQMIFDVLSNLPTISTDCATALTATIEGRTWVDDDGAAWPLIVSGHI